MARRDLGLRPAAQLQLIALAALLAGCPPAVDDDDDSAPLDDDDATEDPTTWTAVQEVLRFRCGCHHEGDGAGGLEGIDDVDLAYDILVGVPSQAVPSMDRIAPGDPDASYLLLKVRDEHRAVGGGGNRMPPTGPALTEDLIASIQQWVADGAAP